MVGKVVLRHAVVLPWGRSSGFLAKAVIWLAGCTLLTVPAPTAASSTFPEQKEVLPLVFWFAFQGVSEIKGSVIFHIEFHHHGLDQISCCGQYPQAQPRQLSPAVTLSRDQ